MSDDDTLDKMLEGNDKPGAAEKIGNRLGQALLEQIDYVGLARRCLVMSYEPELEGCTHVAEVDVRFSDVTTLNRHGLAYLFDRCLDQFVMQEDTPFLTAALRGAKRIRAHILSPEFLRDLSDDGPYDRVIVSPTWVPKVLGVAGFEIGGVDKITAAEMLSSGYLGVLPAGDRRLTALVSTSTKSLLSPDVCMCVLPSPEALGRLRFGKVRVVLDDPGWWNVRMRFAIEIARDAPVVILGMRDEGIRPG